MASITNRVKELRAVRGWTQEQLAAAVGVSRQSINSIERDRYVPSLQLALTFAKIFGCTTDEIFTLNGEPDGRPQTDFTHGESDMSNHLLTRIFGSRVDERFLNHRLRSTSLAGIIGGVAASLLFMYRFYVNHFWSWDVLAIALIIVGVKMGMMLYFVLTD